MALERNAEIVESLQTDKNNKESISELVGMMSQLLQRTDAREKSGDAGSVAGGD